MKRVMLYFGSFNPIHKGHIALAEYAVEKGLCDELVLVVSPQSPYKQAEATSCINVRTTRVQVKC